MIQTDMMREVPSFDIRRCIYTADMSVSAQSGALFSGIFEIGGGRAFRGTELTAACSGTYAVERIGS